ncbi:MAG: hypothetical protein ACLFVG_06745 [Candidatus Aminicenantes bacterium]
MENSDWKQNLADFFEDRKVIGHCRKETVENFAQFCEFIAEPAFESLEDELRKYNVKSKTRKSKNKLIDFQINFPGSRIDHFHYIIRLPRNVIELKLKLQIKARMNKNESLEKREEAFMEKVKPQELLKLPKEAIIQDVIEHYKNFTYRTIAQSE